MADNLRKKILKEVMKASKAPKLSKDYDVAQAYFKSKQKRVNGHLGSIDPITGAVLKKRSHPTFKKAVEGERKAGNIIGKIRRKDVSIPTKRAGFSGKKDKPVGYGLRKRK